MPIAESAIKHQQGRITDYASLFGENFQKVEKAFNDCADDFENKIGRECNERCKMTCQCKQTWNANVAIPKFRDITSKQVEKTIGKLESLKVMRF